MFLRNNIIFLFFIILFFASCNISNNNKNLIIEIETDIDSLKNIYAPDARIALWNVSIINNDDKLKVMAEIENIIAKDDLLTTLKQKYPFLDISIKVLPEKTINALINNSVSSIRGEGNHRAEIVNQALLGTPVKIFKKEGEWNLIQTPNKYIGWINEADIVEMDSVQFKEHKNTKKIIYNQQFGFSYSKADTKSQVVTDLVVGCILPVIDTEAKFYKVKYPDNRIAFVKKDEVIDINVVVNRYPVENELVKTAKKFNGIPYLWGGFSSKAIDCSGFTSIIYFMNGIILQRDASQQIMYGKEITKEYDYRNLEKGDLLFFGQKATKSIPEKVTHVTMYIGDTEFIHASGKVKINSMDSSRANYISGYESSYIKTVRIIGQENGETIEKIAHNKFYKNIIPK